MGICYINNYLCKHSCNKLSFIHISSEYFINIQIFMNNALQLSKFFITDWDKTLIQLVLKIIQSHCDCVLCKLAWVAWTACCCVLQCFFASVAWLVCICGWHDSLIVIGDMFMEVFRTTRLCGWCASMIDVHKMLVRVVSMCFYDWCEINVIPYQKVGN